MSADFVALGPDAEVVVNGIPFAVTSGGYRETVDRADRTDSENTGFKRVKGGLGQLSCNFEAQQSTDITPHIGPLFLRAGNFCTLLLYPFGVLSGRPYNVPHFLVLEFDGDFRVQGSEPQKIRMSGESDDSYTLMDE